MLFLLESLKRSAYRLVHLKSLIPPKRRSEVAQWCVTFCDPTDCSLAGSSIHAIFQARVLEWIAISFSTVSSWPRDRTQVSHIADRCFTLWATREALPNRKLRQFTGFLFFLFCLILRVILTFIVIFHHDETTEPTFYSISLPLCVVHFHFLHSWGKTGLHVCPTTVGNPQLILGPTPQWTKNPEELCWRLRCVLKSPVPKSG